MKRITLAPAEWVLVAVFLWLLSIPIVRATTQNFDTFVSGTSNASQPFGAGDKFPIIQGGVTKYTQGNVVATLTDSQTLTNKTVNCANNTCTVRANLDLTNTAQPANGGLGLSSGTSGGVLCATASTTYAFSSALTSNAPVIGGGAGACPGVGTTSGPGTLFLNGSGSYTSGHGVSVAANGNIVDNANAVFANNANTFTPTQTFGPVIGHHRAVASTTDTLVVSGTPNDCGGVVQYSSTTNVTVTLPNSTPVDCWVDLEQTNTGRVVLSAASGATLTSTHGFTGTFNAAGAIIGLYIDQNSGGAAAHYVLTGDGA